MSTLKIETITGKKPHRFFKNYLKDFREGNLSRREFLAYSTSVGVSSASALAIAGVTPEVAEAQTPKRGGTLRVTMQIQEIKDPAYFAWSQQGNGLRGVLETLLRWLPDGTFAPMLLESWSLSDDGKTWTLKARKGVKWSNGDEFTSEDVAFNFNRWLNLSPKTTMQGRFSGLLEEYDTGEKDDNGNAKMAKRARKGAVEIVDKYTVRLHSSIVDISYIPSIAGASAALIVHRDFDKDGSDVLANPIGTGPFLLQEYAVGERIIKVRRPNGEYWDGDPYLDRVAIIDLKDDEAQVFAAFSADQIDMAYEIASDQLERIGNIAHTKTYRADTANTGVIRFHINTPPFDNPKVRKAIQLLSDNAETLQVAHNGHGSEAEHHHTSPIHPEYAALPKVKRNVAKAKKLLKEAGMAGAEIECNAISSPTWESQTCLALASQAKEAGLKINVNILPSEVYWERWADWPFSLTFWNGHALSVQVYNLGYRTGAVWNETAYANPEFDKLLDDALGTPDGKERSKIFAKLEKMIQDDAILVQPAWLALFNATHKRVQNYVVHPNYEQHFEKIWLSDA